MSGKSPKKKLTTAVNKKYNLTALGLLNNALSPKQYSRSPTKLVTAQPSVNGSMKTDGNNQGILSADQSNIQITDTNSSKQPSLGARLAAYKQMQRQQTLEAQKELDTWLEFNNKERRKPENSKSVLSILSEETPCWEEVAKNKQQDELPSSSKYKSEQFLNHENKYNDIFYKTCIDAILMDQKLKDLNQGRKFLLRTLGKLLNTSNSSVLGNLNLLTLEGISEVSSKIRVLRLDKGAQLPTLKKGMFVVLKGKFQVKTHWKRSKGFDQFQKIYLEYIRAQQGHLASDYAREKKGPIKKSEAVQEATEKQIGKDVQTKMMAQMHQKYFGDTFSSNPYLSRLDTTNNPVSPIVDITTHCASQLQKLMTGEGRINYNKSEKSYLTQVTLQILEKEYKFFEDLTKKQNDFDDDGLGCGYFGPGQAIHQAMLTGSHQYLLHYRITAETDNTLVAYLDRKDFEEALSQFNQTMKNQYQELLASVPAFSQLSKFTRQKMIGGCKKVALPRGWHFNSQIDMSKFFLILNGTFKLSYGKPVSQISMKGGGNEGDLLKLFVADEKTLSQQDRIKARKAVKKSDEASANPNDFLQRNLTKRTDILHGNFFGEENVVLSLRPDWSLYKKLRPDEYYEVTCSSINAEVLIFDVWSLQAALKSEPKVIGLLQKQFRQKIPSLKDYKPNFIDLYNKVLNNKQLEEECANPALQQSSQNNLDYDGDLGENSIASQQNNSKTKLAPISQKNNNNDDDSEFIVTFPKREKRQDFTQMVSEYKQLTNLLTNSPKRGNNGGLADQHGSTKEDVKSQTQANWMSFQNRLTALKQEKKDYDAVYGNHTEEGDFKDNTYKEDDDQTLKSIESPGLTVAKSIIQHKIDQDPQLHDIQQKRFKSRNKSLAHTSKLESIIQEDNEGEHKNNQLVPEIKKSWYDVLPSFNRTTHDWRTTQKDKKEKSSNDVTLYKQYVIEMPHAYTFGQAYKQSDGNPFGQSKSNKYQEQSEPPKPTRFGQNTNLSDQWLNIRIQSSRHMTSYQSTKPKDYLRGERDQTFMTAPPTRDFVETAETVGSVENTQRTYQINDVSEYSTSHIGVQIQSDNQPSSSRMGTRDQNKQQVTSQTQIVPNDLYSSRSNNFQQTTQNIMSKASGKQNNNHRSFLPNVSNQHFSRDSRSNQMQYITTLDTNQTFRGPEDRKASFQNSTSQKDAGPQIVTQKRQSMLSNKSVDYRQPLTPPSEKYIQPFYAKQASFTQNKVLLEQAAAAREMRNSRNLRTYS